MSNQVMMPEQMISAIKTECVQLINAHNDVNFQAEANYAIQLLYGNSYALGVAQKNPASVQNAMRNASAIGISLNPANKHAYLVPRKIGDGYGICLDISYMGLLHLAMSTGSIEWGQAKLVYESDTYVNNGIDKAPTHNYHAFGDRGSLIGCYCTVKTSTGAYLTEEMDVDQLHSVRARSEAFKRVKDGKPCPSGPWVTDYEEMCRKTVVKRASKYWPKVDRLDNAINVLNTESGEGFSKDEVEVDITPVDEETIIAISDYLDAQDRDKEKVLQWLSGKHQREIKSLSELTQHEADKFLTSLKAQEKNK